MSSHREAPAISKDPVADNTDVYAFVTPGNTVTIIANYLPAEAPAGGPNFYEFDDDVRYGIHIDNDGDGLPDVTYQFRFTTTITNPDTFLYNTGPIDALDSRNWNRRQTYSVVKVGRNTNPRISYVGRDLPCPPCNIGPRSTPNYETLAAATVRTLGDGTKAFAGQRADPFFVDLGSVFDLGTLRPVESLHLIPTANAAGIDSLKTSNVHTLAIQVPISALTRDGSVPSDPMSELAVLGVWAGAERQKAFVRDEHKRHGAGPWVQVSRLGNPLFNEVIVPMAEKDEWNARSPYLDKRFAKYVAQPELARLLPVLYPGVFPNLAGVTADRADLLAILLTGIPAGIIPGFQNFTGSTQADMLRLNIAIPPATSPNRLGLLGSDLAGFPNGRRLTDDAVTVELRAVAGATYPLVNPSYTPDGAVAVIEDGTFNNPGRVFLGDFPYIGTPYSGYAVPAA
ncbi:MAG TPA: DUF4331 domain-containing protein [Acidimicrobiales bacterium]|jgi:hypothetical protein|nr:DUF4331 domain-containing protein [Acidimicrobiales bacterium]